MSDSYVKKKKKKKMMMMMKMLIWLKNSNHSDSVQRLNIAGLPETLGSIT